MCVHVHTIFQHGWHSNKILFSSFQNTWKVANILISGITKALPRKAVQKILKLHNRLFYHIILNFYRNAIQNSYTIQQAPCEA